MTQHIIFSPGIFTFIPNGEVPLDNEQVKKDHNNRKYGYTDPGNASGSVFFSSTGENDMGEHDIIKR